MRGADVYRSNLCQGKRGGLGADGRPSRNMSRTASPQAHPNARAGSVNASAAKPTVINAAIIAVPLSCRRTGLLA